MNFEHVEAVRDRIAEIRRRFVDPAEVSPQFGPSGAATAFGAALRNARANRAACPTEMEPMIQAAADRYGIDASVIKAVIRAESGFRPNAVSRVGAQGLMQLMPGTARALGVDPMDPEQNIDGGTRYLRQQLDRFGSLEHALAAYNAGPGAVVRYGGVPPYEETRHYVERVLQDIAFYSGGE